MKTNFHSLMHTTGLSTRGASRLFSVRMDTVKNWKYGRAKVPDNVMSQMNELDEAVQKIFNMNERNPNDG